MSELAVLRTIGLKGRVEIEQLVATTGLDEPAVRASVASLEEAEFAVTTPTGQVRTSKEGRVHLQGLLDQERAGHDLGAVREIYEEFCAINARAKEIFTSWQMTPAGEVNDHSDPSYDEQVLAELDGVHEQILPLVDLVTAIVPRAARYRERLVLAQEKYAGGDHAWVTKPIMDSYHTVWFEMHEDLISWSGLTRAEEAAAGRAT